VLIEEEEEKEEEEDEEEEVLAHQLTVDVLVATPHVGKRSKMDW
jgi:hypothetical protein